MDVRFWERVDRRGADECWPWLGKLGEKRGVASKDYGQFWVNGRLVLAPRVAWELTHGPLGPGECALHRCDNPPCVNPAHLFKGTRGDNNRDSTAKGRHGYTGNPGEANPSAKLTAADVVAIRSALANGEMQTRIAQRYGVTKYAISNIKVGKSWGSLA